MEDLLKAFKEEQKRNEEFRNEVIALLRKMAKVEIKVTDTKPSYVTNDAFENWKNDISTEVKEVLKASNFKNNKAVLSEAYRKMTKNYGIVFAQEQKDFITENGVQPSSNLELCYYIEQKNKACKGLLKSILGNMKNNGVKSKAVLTNYPCKTIKDLDSVVYQLSSEEERSHNCVHTYNNFLIYMKKNTNIDWEKYNYKYRVNHMIFKEKRIQKMTIIREFPELSSSAVKLFNEHVRLKYGEKYSL